MGRNTRHGAVVSDSLLAPARVWTRSEVLRRPSPVPAAPAVWPGTSLPFRPGCQSTRVTARRERCCAEAVADVGGTGPLLPTVFAFPTSSPAEARRLRTLLGADSPILVHPPGFAARAEDEGWCTMRELTGQLGQVRLDVG